MSSQKIINICQPEVTPEFMAQSLAVSEPNIFGDDRDKVIAKFNRLQAFSGTGKGFFSGTDAVEFSNQNQFNRFKTCCYKPKESHSEHDGLVGLVINKPASEFADISVRQAFTETLQKCLASLPIQRVFFVDYISLDSKRSVVTIYALRSGVSGAETGSSKIYSTDLTNALCQPNIAQLLKQSLFCENAYPIAKMSKTIEQQYLQTPQMGIHPMLWQQAVNNNPNPKLFIPVVKIGFGQLNEHVKQQLHTVEVYKSKMKSLSNEISVIRVEQTSLDARTAEMKRKFANISLRILKIFSKLELYRRQGLHFDSSEEELRAKLADIFGLLNNPSGFKSRLSALQDGLSSSFVSSSEKDRPDAAQLPPAFVSQIREHLVQETNGIKHVLNAVNQCAADLRVIHLGLQNTETSASPRTSWLA